MSEIVPSMLLADNHTALFQYQKYPELIVVRDVSLQFVSLLKQYFSWAFLALSLIFLTTYISSTIRFRKALRDPKTTEVPIVPYWVPGVFHALALWDPAHFAFTLSKRFGSQKPLQIKAGWLSFVLLSDPGHVKALFSKSKCTTNTTTVAFTLKNLVGLPSETVSLYLADNSGPGLKPRKESNTLPEHRITFLVSRNLYKYLSSRHLDGISGRYASMLHRRIDAIDIRGEWTSLPDLFTFLQETTLVPEIEALFGLKLLDLNPGLIDDLVVFTQHVPDFLRLRPSWLNPQAHRARKRLIQYVKKWHKHAQEHVDFTHVSDEDPDWEPFWGSRLMRVRQHYEHNTNAMNEDARACEDVGLIWAATTNVQNTSFWLFFEALRDPELHARLLEEVSECKVTNPANGTSAFDVKKLTAQPLLQSTYAEVLRLYVGVAISRVAGFEDFSIDKYRIPRNSLVMTYSRTMALDTEAWTRAGRTLRKPLEEFDAERFLVEPDWTRSGVCSQADANNQGNGGRRRFSTDGLTGLWVPYGGGNHTCPGRHLAKQQMLVTFAMLLSEFEMDIPADSTAAVNTKPDMRFAPFGSLPPTAQVGFRIRRRQVLVT